jgi:hypothetical protein
MPDKEKTNRESPISYRPPKELRDEFRARVKQSGMSTSAFITNSVFSIPAPRQSRRPPVERRQLAKLLAEAAHIYDVLDEIALTDGINGNHAQLLEAACQDLAEIRTAILKLAGRKR